jgi:hypothetical protein
MQKAGQALGVLQMPTDFSFEFVIDVFSFLNFVLLVLQFIRWKLTFKIIKKRGVGGIQIGGMEFYKGDDF